MNQYPQTLLPAKLNHPTQLQQELHGASCEGQSAVQDEPRKPAQQQQTNKENRSGSWGCQPLLPGRIRKYKYRKTEEEKDGETVRARAISEGTHEETLEVGAVSKTPPPT